jgi:uncharacterized membrane protein (DUF485 family)
MIKKKSSFHPSFLQIIYLIVYLILFGLIVYTPHLISGPVHITKKLILEEEIIEGFLLGILFLLNILILQLYRNEDAKQKMLISKIKEDKKSAEGKLYDSFRYIGLVNVQLQQIKSIFDSHNNFPETKNDFRKTLLYFGQRVFGIVDANWVLFRIIDCNTERTLYEQFEVRHGFTFGYPHISNKSIVEQHTCSPFTTVISDHPNLNIIICCIIPMDKISNEEKIFINAIVNEITMLFVIMNSAFYKSQGSATAAKRSPKMSKKIFSES